MDLNNGRNDKDLKVNKESDSKSRLFFSIIFALIITFGVIYAQDYYSHNDFSKESNEPVKSEYIPETQYDTSVESEPQVSLESRPIDKLKNTQSDIITIKLNPLEDYYRNTKEKMYEIRKSHVAESLFASPNYEPNEEVFGQIQDGKPWWSYPGAVCSVDSNENPINKARGLSTMSRFINNPDLLVGTYFGFYLNRYNKYKPFCESQTSRTIPYELTYNPKLNLFTAKYKMIRYVIENKINYAYNQEEVSYPLHLIGVNAKDFGYSYIYISNLQNIEMLNVINASNKVHRFADFIHTGGSCGDPEGCNNISPRQPELEYFLTGLPAVMEIKLWHQEPENLRKSADINYKIIFEEQ